MSGKKARRDRRNGRLQGRGSADPPNYPVPGVFLILKMKMVVKMVVQ
ncbi:MAG: hypothetical protein ACOY4F_08920 [Thermodesulfobacteriota bacterium]